jgi:hypothetical protein
VSRKPTAEYDLPKAETPLVLPTADSLRHERKIPATLFGAASREP